MTPSTRRLLGQTFLAAILAWQGPSHAQATTDCPPNALPLTPERVQAGAGKARDHGFLWRITKAGHSSYLYGTLHVARLEWMFPGPTVLEALEASDTVALELDVLDPQVQRRLAVAMTAARGFDLPEPLKERLRRRIDAECVEPGPMARMGPELQAASLTGLAARRDGLDPAYSIDMMLSIVGHGRKKRMVSLETPEAQIQALQLPTPAEATAFVAEALDDLDAGRARPLMNRMATMWAAGDHAELARYEEWCECRRTPAERTAMKRILDDRNPALAESIDALHSSGRHVFAAVGSLHMVGPRGLPALLTRMGFKVEAGEFER